MKSGIITKLIIKKIEINKRLKMNQKRKEEIDNLIDNIELDAEIDYAQENFNKEL